MTFSVSRPHQNFPLALTTLLALIVIGFWPVLLRQQSLLPVMPTLASDTVGPRFVLDPMVPAWSSYPIAHLVHRQWRSGEPPRWNPFSGCGEPHLAHTQAGVTSPLRAWTALISPSPALWDFYCLARLFLAGVLAWVWARALGLGAAGSLMCGGGYMLSGFLILNVNLDVLDAEIWLPAVAAGVLYWLRNQTLWAWLLMTLAGAAMLLVGNPQVVLVNGGFIVVLAMLAWWSSRSSAKNPYGPSDSAQRDRTSGRARSEAARSLLAMGAMVFAAVCAYFIAAPGLLPMLDFLPRAQHVHGGAGAASEPLWGAVSLVAPWLLGKFGEPWSGVNPFHFLPYAGLGVTVLAVAGFRVCWRTPGGSAICLAPLFLLAVAYGLPPVSWVGRLPGLELLWWTKYQGPTYLCLATLAGFGVQVLCRAVQPAKVRGRRTQRSRRGSAVGLAGGAVAVALAELLMLMPHDRPQVHDPLKTVPYVDELKSKMQPMRERFYAAGNLLHPHAGAALSMMDARTTYGIYPRRAYWYMRGLVTGPARTSGEAVMTGSPRAFPALASPALSALAVRWVAVKRSALTKPLPSWLHLRSKFPLPSDEILILENSSVLPRARLIDRAIRVTTPEQALYETSGHPAHPRIAYVEGPKNWVGFVAHGPPSAVRILEDTGPRVVCEIPQFPRPRVLLLADTWEPGWRAYADGVRLRVLPANCMFRAVAVPPNTQRVVFHYEPLPVRIGLLLSAVTLAAIVAVAGLVMLRAQVSRALGAKDRAQH